jgi:hypothetical protein
LTHVSSWEIIPTLGRIKVLTFLSKTRFVWGRQCHRRLWLGSNQPGERAQPEPGSVMGQGIEVGIAARACWPGGVLINSRYDQYQEALARTKALIADPSVSVIFEAAFVFEHVLIRADVIERLPEGRWRLYEVKSSTSFHEKYLEEITLQAYIILANKLKLAELYLVHLDKQYIRNGVIDWNALFIKEDVTEDCRPLFDNIWEQINEMHGVLALSEPPAIRPDHHCFEPYDCEYWDQCIAAKPDDWIFNIPRLSKQKFERFERYDYESMRDIPACHVKQLTPTQQGVVKAAQTGKVWRSPSLAGVIAPLVPPISYLDFETFSPAIPLYCDTKPYERIAVQWSCHHDDGARLSHFEFLAHGATDPRREFAETLLEILEGLQGPITVWHHFEGRVIRELARLLPDLADRLEAIIARIVDLLEVTRKHIYHPDFRGSYSMKAVVPAIAPDLSYSDLDITEGTGASAAFYRVAFDPTLSTVDRIRLRHALLAYCGRDTIALMRVHQWLKSHD